MHYPQNVILSLEIGVKYMVNEILLNLTAIKIEHFEHKKVGGLHEVSVEV